MTDYPAVTGSTITIQDLAREAQTELKRARQFEHHVTSLAVIDVLEAMSNVVPGDYGYDWDRYALFSFLPWPLQWACFELDVSDKVKGLVAVAIEDATQFCDDADMGVVCAEAAALVRDHL